MADSTSIISSMATGPVLAELVALYATRTGHAVRRESAGGVEVARRLRAGETFDIVVLAADAVEALASEGILDRNSLSVFARSRTAVAVRAGAPRPAICDEASVRDLIDRAGSIGVSTGPSGVAIVQMLKGWGTYEATKSRIVQAPPGVPVGRLLQRGDVDVGFQQLSELRGHPGIEIVGSLPENLLPLTDFTIATTHRAATSSGALALMRFLLSDAATDALQRFDMETA